MNRPSFGLRIVITVLILGGFAGLLHAGRPIAIKGGRIVTVTAGVIENGTLIIRDGRIEAVGKDIRIPSEADVIDAAGTTILPGFIDGFTNLGIADFAAFGSDDDEASDPVAPHLHVTDALNPENRFIPLARASGVIAAICAPADGNLLTGQSALIRLKGVSIEEMGIKFPAAVHGCLGEPPKMRYGKMNQMPMTRMGAAALLRQTLIDAQAYVHGIDEYEKKLAAFQKSGKKDEKEPNPPAIDPKKMALRPVLEGKIPLILSADRYDDILTALRMADEFNLKLILNHGAEAGRMADVLASKKVPVIIGPLAHAPLKLETMNSIKENAAWLSRAGVKIAFQTGSIQNASGLLAEARLAVANGLPPEEAMKALTIYPAQIFGVDAIYGSLEVGKSASLVIFDGDPLAMRSQVKMVFIDGKKM
ncbi:MAG: amidohydrolase family protein [Candidatus Aminicenantales bacterium]